MLGFVTLGTNDLVRAAPFYDAIAAELNCHRIMDNDTFIVWGPTDGGPGLALRPPEDGRTASAGHGIVVGLQTDDRAQVDRLHALALSMGATDVLAPVERFTGYYTAEFLDLDGNRLNAFSMG